MLYEWIRRTAMASLIVAIIGAMWLLATWKSQLATAVKESDLLAGPPVLHRLVRAIVPQQFQVSTGDPVPVMHFERSDSTPARQREFAAAGARPLGPSFDQVLLENDQVIGVC